MGDFNAEFKNIANVEMGGNYISTPGVHIVAITKAQLSEQANPSHTGTPYIEFTFKTAEGGLENTTKLYRVKDGDSPDTQKYKNQKLREIFENAGISLEQQGVSALQNIIGKQIKALFRSEEYVGYDKTNANKPIVKSIIKYLYSSKANAALQGNESYFKSALKEKERKRYEFELAEWNKKYGQATTAPSGPPANVQGQPAAAPQAAPEHVVHQPDGSADDDSDDMPF